MSQVSKDNLAGSIQKDLYDQFFFILADLKGNGEAEDFIGELLTKTEKLMFIKRLGIALLLVKGYTYRDIRGALKVSFPTIRSVQFWLDHGRGGYKRAVEKIVKKEGGLVNFLEKIDKVLDKAILFLPDNKKGFVDPLKFADKLSR